MDSDGFVMRAGINGAHDMVGQVWIATVVALYSSQLQLFIQS